MSTTFTVAKEEDGGVQITFTIPYSEVKKAQDETIAEMAPNYNIPGFRKGKAPLSEVAKKIPQQELVQHSLGHILPQALNEAIKKEKLNIAVYPRYELVSSENGKDWVIKAITCEIPEIKLGDYKTKIKGLLKTDAIIVPGKEEKKELTRDEKEQEVLKFMLEHVKIKIPKVLLEEEVGARLSSLLARIEKLGLTLESYLASLNKKVEDLRKEYEEQAKQALTIEFILTRIAEEEKVKVDEKEVEAAVKMMEASQQESQARYVRAILQRREALTFLINLAS